MKYNRLIVEIIRKYKQYQEKSMVLVENAATKGKNTKKLKKTEENKYKNTEL